MAKRIFLAIVLFFSFPVHTLEAKDGPTSPAVSLAVESSVSSEVVQGDDNEIRIPAKEAHDNPQKWVNIILGFILAFSAVGLAVIAIIIRKSKK